MTNLVTQSSKSPTRKVWAVILSGVIVGAVQGGLSAAFPEADWRPLLQEMGPWVTAAIMSAAGYLTRERA
mgnify:CR=1 FL=1